MNSTSIIAPSPVNHAALAAGSTSAPASRAPSTRSPVPVTVAHRSRSSSSPPPWLFAVISVSFLVLALSLLLSSPTTNHPCPYADVLGLEKTTSALEAREADVRGEYAMPAGHVSVEGRGEEDCPHLMIQRIARERQQRREDRRRRQEAGGAAVQEQLEDDDAELQDAYDGLNLSRPVLQQ